LETVAKITTCAQSVNHFDNFYETRNFIDEMVKPDYNNWEGKDDYAERFMDIIEKIPLNELQNTKTGPLPLSPVTIVSLPSNTNKILQNRVCQNYI
jgi:hypothetical protein